MNTPVTGLEIRDGRVVAIEAGGERIEPSHVISSLPLRRDRRHGRRRRARLTVQARRPGPALPRLPDRRARRSTARTCSRTTGSTSTTRTSASAGSRTSAPGAPGWSPTSPRRRSASSTSASRATTCGRWTTTALVELAKQELATLGLCDPSKVEKGYVTRVPKAYPMYDADYADSRRGDQGLARDRREPDPGRPQRPAPLQQLGPLDAHGDARGGEHHRGHQARHLGGQRRVRVPRGDSGWTSTRTSARPRRAACASPSPTLRFPELETGPLDACPMAPGSVW